MVAHSGKRSLIFKLVALGFVVMFLSTSIKSIYQVYFSDLAAQFGRGRADFAWSGALFMLVTGLVSPLVGAISDRYGPIQTVLFGAVVGGCALLGVSWQATSLPFFIVAYGIGAAFALAAMTYVPMGMLVDQLFEQKHKGFAYALVTNGTAIGFIVLSPMWIWLQPQLDWQVVYLLVGCVFLGPMAALLFWSAAIARKAGLAQPTPAPKLKHSVWRQIRRDPVFYVLALGFMGCGSSMAFIDVHLVPFWQDAGTSRVQMGMSMSLLGVLELASGLATGWMAIYLNKRSLLGVFYLMRSMAMLMLLNPSSTVQTLGFAALFGASYLGTVVLTSMYCFERYGAQIKGQVFGLLFLIHQVGAFATVQLGAWSYDKQGSYQITIVALAVLTVVGAIFSWFGLPQSEVTDRGEAVAN